jgi:phosphatidylserine decarboxylase
VRIPLAKYGVRELIIFGGTAFAVAVAAGVWLSPFAAILPAALGVFVMAFFRDPERRTPTEEGILVSPADGRVTEVAEVDGPPALPGRVLKIGIFMSLFNVHVNRSPCDGRVESVEHKPGRYLNAMDPASSTENESAWMVVSEAEGRPVRIVVRQVAGLIARRIVTRPVPGDRLRRGERFGMIKFGSRLEVYVPVEAGFEPRVAIGQNVKAGHTVLGRLP